MSASIANHLGPGLLVLAAAGCSGDPGDALTASRSDAFASVSELSLSADRNTLARTHDVTVDVDAGVLEAGYRAVQSRCNEMENCTILTASIDSGDDRYRSARLRLRLLPESVSTIEAAAASFGEVIRRSTDAVDLAEPILDQEERLSMLRRYMEDLKGLRESARDDVEALIRVASEIASTQSQIESAEGQRAHLQQRVDTEVLSINFVVDQARGFWGTVVAAFVDFGDELANGIASTVRGVAFILPWLVVVIPLLLLVRWIWRRTRNGWEP